MWGRKSTRMEHPINGSQPQFNNLEPNHQFGQQTSKKSTKNKDLWTNLGYRSSGCSSRHPCRPRVFNIKLIFGIDLWETISEIENSGTWVLCIVGLFRSPWIIYVKFISIWEKIVVLWKSVAWSFYDWLRFLSLWYILLKR